MSKLNISGKLPEKYDRAQITDILRDIEAQVNSLSEGSISARYNSKAAAPVIGTWSKGDMVYNTTPAEAGTVGGKYVVMGWICTASGEPGTWLAARALTGN